MNAQILPLVRTRVFVAITLEVTRVIVPVLVIMGPTAWQVSFSSCSQIRVRNWRLLFLFLNKTYVVGTQKNHLNETILLSIKNTFLNWRIRK